jgi:NADH-quinone oxidoreductase subunit N
MLAQTVDWLAVAPAVAVAVTALAVLLVDLFAPGRPALVTAVAVAGTVAGLVAVGLLWDDPRATFCVGGAEGFPSCSYVVNQLTLAFQGVVLVGTLIVVLLSHADTTIANPGARTEYRVDHGRSLVSTARLPEIALDRLAAGGRLPAGEMRFLLLASATGALVLAAGRDLATIVVALEVVSLPAFALVGLRRQGRRDSEAALTFFIVSVVSIAVMIYGISLVYGATGAIHLDRIATELSDPEGRTAVATAGVVLTLVGLAFKIGAVPFHFWVPDTYAGAPVAVAAYLSVVSKAAGIVGLVVVVAHGFPAYADVWGPMIAALAVATMTLGNVAALRQRSAIRLLAWSSVAHAGYLLVPLGVASTGVEGGVLGAALSATVAYVCIYAVINLAAFGVVAVVSRNHPGSAIADYRGLASTEPASAIALGFGLVALAGLPPGVAGLWAKVVVVDAAVTGGAGWLAIAVAINTVIGLVYYLRWTVLLFLPAAKPGQPLSYDVPVASGLAVGLALAAGVALSVLPQLVLGLADASAGILG